MAHDFTDVEFMLETLDNMLSGKGETLTKTHTVREFLFDGFSVQAFLDLLKDPLVEAAGEVKIPEMIADGKMGLLKGVIDLWYLASLSLSSSKRILVIIISCRKTVRLTGGMLSGVERRILLTSRGWLLLMGKEQWMFGRTPPATL